MASTLGLTVAAAVSSAAAQTTISGDSPFPPPPNGPCDNELIDDDAELFMNSEVEPWLDVNPTDPDNLIAVWQQDRFSNGGSRANAGAYSTDRGEHWVKFTLPSLTKCTAGRYARATDPWVTFSPNGHAYAMSLVFDNFPLPNRPGDAAANAMVVHKSTDGGASWTGPIELIRDTNARLFNDKNSMTADPNDSNYVYAVWDRLNTPLGSLINPDNVIGLGFKGPTLFTRTTNGGISWEPPKVIYDPGGNNQTIGNQIVVLPPTKGGTVLNFFNEILNFKNSAQTRPFVFNLAFKYSTDKGATWLPKNKKVIRAQTIATLAQFRTFGTILPDRPPPDNGVRGGDILFDVAVDRANGNLYAVWQDARFSDFAIDQVAFSQSTDGGATWSAPIKVNQTPEDIPLPEQQAFTPSVSVAGNGTVVINYYDFRADTGNDDPNEELADYWAAFCSDDCGDATNWGGEERLTGDSFNILEAPLARGYFLGDYEGLAAIGDDGESGAAFAIPQDGDPADIVFQRFPPP